MSVEKRKAIARRVYEDVLNAGDLELVRDVIAAEAVDHASHAQSSLPIGGGTVIGDFLMEICSAFPDVHWTIDHIQGDGDMVVIQTTMAGSHHAEFRGLPPRGRQFALAAVDTIRFNEGKIVEHWGELDLASLRQQLLPPCLAEGAPDVGERHGEWPRSPAAIPHS